MNLDDQLSEAKRNLLGKSIIFKPWCMKPQKGKVKAVHLIDGQIKAWISDELPIGERKFCPQWCNIDEVSFPRETLGGGKTPSIGG